MCIIRLSTCSALLFVGTLSLSTVYVRADTPKSGSKPGAEKLIDDGKYTEAKTAYAAEVKAAPKSVASRVGLLRCLLRLDDWRTGITESKAALAALPQEGRFHAWLSLFFMRGGQPVEATKEAGLAMQTAKDDYWTLLAEGRVLNWQYKAEEARKLFKQAEAMQPTYEEAFSYQLSTYSEWDAAEMHRVVDAVRQIEEKKHPRKAPKDPEEAEQRKNLDAKAKTDRDKLVAYYDGFAKDQPFQLLSPYTETSARASDQGEEPPFSFTFPIERGEGEVAADDIIIPMTIDGVKVHMLFDTGAGEGFALAKQPAARLNLPVLAKGATSGVNGMELTKLHRAEKVVIGKETFHSIPVESIDGTIGTNDGLIGGGVFNKYVVTVDFKANTMTLARGKGAAAPKPLKGDKVVEVPFHYWNGYILVQISVDNHQFWTMLDTGAERYGVISLDLAQQLAKERDKTSTRELVARGRMGIGISDTTFKLMVFDFPIDVGCLVGDRTPYFIEMDELMGTSLLDKLSAEEDFQLAGLLGISYLATRCSRVSIDYPNRLLTMEMPE